MANVIAPSGNGHMLISALLVHQWVPYLDQETSEIVLDDLQRDETATKIFKVF